MLDLRGANLEGLRLIGADLAHSRLEEAFLRDADLSRAWLVGATFQRADFRGALLSGTRVMRADLSQARNLDRSALAEMRGDESTVWPESERLMRQVRKGRRRARSLVPNAGSTRKPTATMICPSIVDDRVAITLAAKPAHLPTAQPLPADLGASRAAEN